MGFGSGSLLTERSICAEVGLVSEEELAPSRILQAAEELFSARGYAGVSVRDVAERAGVKKASVFYHFGSKPELFEKVLEGYYQLHANVLDEAVRVAGTPRERMHRLLDAYLDFIEDNQRWVRLVQIEIASDGDALPRIRHGLRALYERVAEIFGQLVPESGPLAARQFFVSFSGIVNTYHLYAPVLGEMWDGDVGSSRARRERREHVHWVADAMFDRLSASS